MTTTSSSNSGQLAQRVRTVATISAASALAAVVAFVVSILSARVLGPAGRGEVATVLQFAYIVAPFVGFGADRLLLRRDDYDHGLIPSGFAMTVVALIACAIAGVVYGPWTAMAGVVALVTVSFSMVRAMAISRHRVSFFVVVFIGFQGSVLLISAALYFAGVEDWRWWAAAYIFPALPLAIWSLAKSRKHTDSRVGGVVETARTNAPFIASGLGPLTTTRLGRVLLPALASPASLGLFVVVATATEPLYWIAQSVADQRTSDQRGRELTPSRVLRHLGIVTAAYGALGALGGVALYFLIVPVFGHEFEPARELVLPLTIAAVVLGCYRHLCGEILGSDNPRRIGRVELISAVIAVICYPIGILLGDALGLAWTSAVVYFAAAVVAAVALMRPTGGQKNPSTTTEELPVDVIEEA
ncbi:MULTISPECIES: lipopolysaccharide biosynthesis protein [unclassified Corynebacterium]|uniref:lipopolysaccharide biosynthesis protein n=1 Tax=unclassified Corynebacterium TaxID=2624378 RepID=UPI00034E48B3|nr:hypothetical protein [Corynebacterium sp. HFH0082]EPD48527.1 hypothetical protein HMPREF1206_00476 [Corynebacterium sp. HFH0082]